MSLILKPPFPRLRRGHPLTNGLVFAAPFYEGNGGKLHDISGRDLHGTLTGMDPATDWVGSPYGWALDFDGSNDCIICGPSADLPKQAITVRAHATSPGVASPDFSRLVATDDGNAYGFVLYRTDAAGWRFLVYVSSFVGVSFATVSANAWTDVCGTYDGAAVKLYTDGVLRGSAALTGAINYGSGLNLVIGASGRATPALSEYWLGKVSNVLIYNRALAASEIAELYAFPGVIYEQPKKYWFFSGASPQTITLDFIASGEAVQALTVRNTVTLDGIGSGEAIHDPAAKQNVSLEMIASGEAAHEPSVRLAVALQTISSGEAMHDLAATRLTVALEGIGSGAAIFDFSAITGGAEIIDRLPPWLRLPLTSRRVDHVLTSELVPGELTSELEHGALSSKEVS